MTSDPATLTPSLDDRKQGPPPSMAPRSPFVVVCRPTLNRKQGLTPRSLRPTLNRKQGSTPRSLLHPAKPLTPRSLSDPAKPVGLPKPETGLDPREALSETGLDPAKPCGPAKPVRGRLPAYLKPETGLDPAKPCRKQGLTPRSPASDSHSSFSKAASRI